MQKIIKKTKKVSEKAFKVALLCGGPSLERGISINSARSILDHLASDDIEIAPIYFDEFKRAYRVSTAELYSNNPSDFDFKLKEKYKPLQEGALARFLKSVDIAFPSMHGAYGEDGAIQMLLEKYKVPFVGSPSLACKKVFDKFKANELIKSYGFYTLPSIVLKIYAKNHKKLIDDFFKMHNIKRAIVKPATGGSSIGVFSVSDVDQAMDKVKYLFSKRIDTRVVIEPFAEGIEFTTILLENHLGQGVAVLPTEIEADYSKHQIFDFRKKYLPTRAVTYHCPPRFSNEIIEKIQIQAEQLFKIFGMRDFARFDGWVFPNGNIWFSDFNPISGMEQNSFLFQQSARLGFSHQDILLFILKNACRRNGIDFPNNKNMNQVIKSEDNKNRKIVPILFGGNTAERQVSLMSGANVWLKLRKSKKYEPRPYVLGLKNDVWEIPYALILNHTVEEIIENGENAVSGMKRLKFLIEKVLYKLSLKDGDISEPFFLPRRYTLAQFIKSYRNRFIFIALHGGMGEDGSLQRALEREGIKYNGPNSKVSKLCMDKYATACAVKSLKIQGVFCANQKLLTIKSIKDISKVWFNLLEDLNAKTVIVKPRGDGCSAGIVRLFDQEDLRKYIHLLKHSASVIPIGTFKNQKNIIEMPTGKTKDLLFENFIETDVIKISKLKLRHLKRSGWIEVTVGVLEDGRDLRVLNPSLTVAEGEVLSVEEKFQGGTGVNITPPPKNIVSRPILEKVKDRIGKVARGLGITGYSRIDAFMNLRNADVIIIEVNTLPALTPSTVIYHQALAEKKAIFPRDFIEKIINNKGY